MKFPLRLLWHPRLTLGALCLMLTVPFLMAHHQHPIPAFYQEWVAALCGLFAMLFLLGKESSEPLEIPELCLLPFGLLLILVAQWTLLPAVLPARLQLFALYLIWASLMLILGRQLARALGLETLGRCLASAILLGALLEAGTAALQLEGSIGLPWIFPHNPTIGVRGNLAQNNSFSNYLWLGLAAALYLRSQQWLNRTMAGICIAILIVFTVLSGSRSTWLYAGALTALSTWAVWRWPTQPAMRRLLRWSCAALIGAILFQLLVSSGLLLLLSDASNSSSGSRLLTAGSADPMRYALWHVALLTWQDHPLLGAGIGQYTWQFHQHVLALMPMRLPGLPEHAHNLPLQLLAEAGLVAFLLLLILTWRWAVQLVRQSWVPAHWYFAATLLILALHSNLEYPLWYTFFLGPAALMAGAVSSSNPRLKFQRLTRPLLAGILLLAALTLHTLRSDYKVLEEITNGRLAPGSVESQRQQLLDQAKSLSHSLFTPYLDLLAASVQSNSPDTLEVKLATCDRALRFSATHVIVFKCAHLQALAGKVVEAKQALVRAVASYPGEAELVRQEWRSRAANEPAIALLLQDFPATVPIAAQR